MEIKKVLIAILLICAIGAPVYGASVAKQVDFMAAGLQQDDAALSGGLIYTYEAGTTTAKTCYTDRAKTTPETNPVVLDSEGRSTTFCDGIYKMVIKDPSGVTLVTMDGVSYGEAGTQTVNLSDYDSLSEAVADIGGDNTVLIIDTTDTLNASVTVPSNITLMPMVRDAITLNSKTLTVNGDIWAGAFEWVIGTGTFAGSPVVQYYDPTWTASTVTDSATPSYKIIQLNSPVITIANMVTPAIADFTNSTHTHISNTTGGLITQSVRDSYRNLYIINTTEKVVTITADEAILQDSNGGVLRLSSVNESIDITNSGIHGLDADSELASDWYYIWMIGNSTANAGIISNSASSPTLPSGYTFKGLFGAVRNDASSNFVGFKQNNGNAYYTSLQRILLEGSGTAGAWTAHSGGTNGVKLTVIAPSIANSIQGVMISAAGDTVGVSPVSTGQEGSYSNVNAGTGSTFGSIFTTTAGHIANFDIRNTGLDDLYYFIVAGSGVLELRVRGYKIN